MERYYEKSEILEAYQNVTLEDYTKLALNNNLAKYSVDSVKRQKDNAKIYAEYLKDKDKMKSIFIVSGFVRAIQIWFYCLSEPWRKGRESKDIENCNHNEILKETYKKVEEICNIPDNKIKETRIEKDNIKNMISRDEICIGKGRYAYILGEEILEQVDNLYLKLVCKLLDDNDYTFIFPIDVLDDDGHFWSKILLRMNNLSIRGKRRVKLWDTFIMPATTYTRRATEYQFFNLHPEALHNLDNNIVNKAEALFSYRQTRYPSFDWGLENMFTAVHPHIKNLVACWGGWSGKLSISSMTGFAWIYIKQLRGFLNTWSPESPYWDINSYFNRTFRFEPIKRRKLVNINAIDAKYIYRIGINLFSELNHFAAKILASEKHVNGYYSMSLLKNLSRIIPDMMINTTRTISTLAYFSNKDGKYKTIAENPWEKIRSTSLNNWKDNKFGLFLQGNNHSFLTNTIDRIRVLCEIELKRIKSQLTYEDIEKISKSNNTRGNGEIISQLIPLSRVIELYKERYVNEKENKKLESLGLEIDRVEENKTIDMLNDPSIVEKVYKNILIETFDTQVNKLNKKKEKYQNEINILRNDKEQVRLFSS